MILEEEVKNWHSKKIAAFNKPDTTTLERTQLKTILSKTKDNRSILGETMNANSTNALLDIDAIMWQNIDSLYYLASILGRPRSEVFSNLVRHASRAGQLDQAIQLCRFVLAHKIF